MAWSQQSIFNVIEPASNPIDTESEEERLRDMFRNMPPFIRISSRRAREALIKYEAFKQRYVENLRNNPVYKFVMQVAAFTNEDMEKYWRGKSLAPFMEEHTPENIKIEKEDIELLVNRAREHAFADLHQFCTRIEAIPMFRPPVIFPKSKTELKYKIIDKNAYSDYTLSSKTSPEPEKKGDIKLKPEDADVLSGTERPEVTIMDYLINVPIYDDSEEIILDMMIDEYKINNDGNLFLKLKKSFYPNDYRVNTYLNPDDNTLKTKIEFIVVENDQIEISEPKYIYNMSDSEFFNFYKKFLSEKSVYTKEDVYDRDAGRNRIGRYVLGDVIATSRHSNAYRAHKHNDHKVYMKLLRKKIDEKNKQFAKDIVNKLKDINTNNIIETMKEFEKKFNNLGQLLDAINKRINNIEEEYNYMSETKTNDGIDITEKKQKLKNKLKILNLQKNDNINKKEVLNLQIIQLQDLLNARDEDVVMKDINENDILDILVKGSDGVYDHTSIYRNGKRRRDDDEDVPKDYDMYDDYEYTSLKVPNESIWAKNVPVVHWEDKRPEFWFQRYVARWLRGGVHDQRAFGNEDIQAFQSKFRRLFNNLSYDGTKWIRDLTGLRLSKMLLGRAENKSRRVDGSSYLHQAESEEGELSRQRPTEVPSEVPLKFVEPLFNERFAYWKHSLVLGEYEKRSQYQADKWLQKTPWAIGKLYLLPSISGHMMEAHVAISTKYKKYEKVELIDILGSEKHSFFFSKLVALCIRTSAILSGKKYGLDKMYMRLNMEKRRIMFSFGKLDIPTRLRSLSTRVKTKVKEGVHRNFRYQWEHADADTRKKLLLNMLP
jgi:hypothetical protein